MKIKKFLLALTSILTIGTLSSCGNDKPDEPAITEDAFSYDWVYSEENADEYDPYMLIDGKLDEPIWQDRQWLHHTDKGIELSFTSYFTKYGFYLAGIAKDPGIKWFSRLYFQNNSSFWFNIKPAGTIYTHATEVMNIFIDPYNAVSRNLNRFVGKATTDKPIGEGATTMTCEMFMSWKELHVEIPEGKDYPEMISVNPHYRYVESSKSASNDWVRPLFFFEDNGRHKCSGRFTANGYKNADLDNAIVGNAKNGISKSDGWDLSMIDLGAVKSDGPHSQAIFFKDICSTKYVFETKMQLLGGIDDTFPSAGICNAADEVLFDTFHITGVDILNNNSSWACHHLSLDNNGRPGWVDKTLYSVSNPGYQVVTFKCIRDDSTFHYIVNDQYLGAENISHFGKNGSCPGFYTLGGEAIFFDYSAKDYEGDEEGLEAEIMKHAYPSKIVVTGNGTAVSNPTAVVSGKGVTISVSPTSGNILSDFYITNNAGDIIERDGKPVDLNYYLENAVDGQLYIPNITEKIITNISFEQFEGDTTRIITSIYDELTKLPIANTKYSIKDETDKRLYFTGQTGNAGGVSLALPKAGTYSVGSKSLVVTGNYKLYIEQSNFATYVGDINVPADAGARLDLDAFYCPNLHMNQNIDKEFEDGQYVYYSKANSFKYSGYEYSGVYADTAVYSVEISSPDEVSSWGSPGWDYNMGIIMTQGDLIDSSITRIFEPFNNNTYREYKNPGNEYYGVHVGIAQNGVQTNIGPLDYITERKKFETGLGGMNPHERVFTAVLKDNVLYYYVDSEFVGQEDLDSDKYNYTFTDDENVANKFNYKFSKDRPVMFGVNFTNNQTSGVKAKVVTEVYGQDALVYLDNFSATYKEVK